jgi:hypothetical protein
VSARVVEREAVVAFPRRKRSPWRPPDAGHAASITVERRAKEGFRWMWGVFAAAGEREERRRVGQP